MEILISIALLSWIPICLVLFLVFPRRQAVLLGMVGAWLYLPPMGIALAGIPDYNKGTAFSFGILLAMLIFTPERFARLRPSWVDLPLVVYILCPMITSSVNDLGAYDGFSTVFGQLTGWGGPYLIGRLNFDEPRDVRSLAVAIVVGGLTYIPFCFAEVGVGPILLSKLYGTMIYEDIRLGGSRPRVFLNRGLELGVWMSVCSLMALWLWRSGALRRIAGLSFGAVWLPILLFTTLLCRSSGALMLLALAIIVLELSARLNRKVFMIAWLSVSLVYVGVRIPNYWDYSGLISFLANNFDPDRAESLEFRFRNEDMLSVHAMQRPVFGWGGWGRSRVHDESGKDITITDGLWIIIFGVNGFVGLFSFLGMFLIPSFAFVKKFPVRRWTEPDVGAMAAIVAMLGLHVFDLLLNAFPNAVYVAAAGALATAVQAKVGARAGLEAGGEPPAGLEGPRPSPVSAEERLAERYIEMARTLRINGGYEAAADARRFAYETLSQRAGEGIEAPASRRRRLDCGNDLAWLLASRPDPRPGDREEAAELARRTTAAEPDNPTFWNTLALALCRVGDDDEAYAAALRSMELEGSWNGYDLVVLALTDARLGRKDEAARWLAEAGRWRDERDEADRTLDELIRETEAALDA
ncbi:hypothetical protein [Paludisphaera mucosa]|uniref:Uncharacterized protein n=1 Tax=Paludisphaera mucosa TaxID=3030827 RepID=A0ABT6FGT1_9BACT|nr:hypothetical protein [Paludisphaera mucosa]MDG3006777.1 hypothetical protein [Paludisphaera mucosa]